MHCPSLFPWEVLSGLSGGSHHVCSVEDRHDAEGIVRSVHANSMDVATTGF